MDSQSIRRKALLNATAAQEHPQGGKGKRTYKRTNVYEAVAGRISSAGFIPKSLKYASTRDTPSSSVTAAAPESVLFRSQLAPTRYQESDVYFANEKVPNLKLPDSELLKAIHCYTSDYFGKAVRRPWAGDFKSMDGTALLALGILIEEACIENLGKDGDLVLTEGEKVVIQTQQDSSASSIKPSKRRKLEI